MLSGDHVLPRITPNIPFHPQAGADPLGDYLQSLDKLESYDADEVLPAHEHRFVGLAGSGARAARAPRARGSRRSSRRSRDGTTPPGPSPTRMHWSRPWDRIDGFMRRAAVGEAMAHLRALEQRGIVRSIEGEPMRWELIEPAKS